MRVIKAPQNFKLTLDLFKYAKLADFLFIKYLDSNFMARLLMECHPDFTKGTISKIFGESILSNPYFVYRHF